MDKKRFLQWGVLFMMGIFVLGAAVPAMADANNAKTGKLAGFLNRGKAWVSMNCGGNGAGKSGAQTMVKALADLTGLDVNTITQERQAGKSLAAIAQEKSVTEEALINKIMTANETRLKGLVDAGKMTQAQYDTCVAQMQTKVKAALESTAVGKGQGHMGHGKGFGMGQGRGLKNSSNTTPAAQ